jgi:hypothetical protein
MNPKRRRRYLSGSNEYFDSAEKTCIKMVPQRTANVAVGTEIECPRYV